jgi:hypothetical protein
MKKIIFAGILAGAVLIGGCGGAKEPEKTESLTQEQQDSIAEAMTSKVDEMVESLVGQADVELPEITIGGIDITDPAGGAIGSLIPCNPPCSETTPERWILSDPGRMR